MIRRPYRFTALAISLKTFAIDRALYTPIKIAKDRKITCVNRRNSTSNNPAMINDKASVIGAGAIQSIQGAVGLPALTTSPIYPGTHLAKNVF
jgi:hypothetical protein